MKKGIVITTINPPRDEITAFAALSGWHLYVSGDTKTPEGWQHDNVTYIGPKAQDKLFPKLSKVMPWRRYARKMFAHLMAIKDGVEIICDTDDDVFPYKNFPPDLSLNKKVEVLSNKKFINIYNFYEKKPKSWPRGFPLDFIKDQEGIKRKTTKVHAPMQNSVIDQDGDFDAIYRLIFNDWVKLKKTGEYAIEKGSYCPVNTQNTFTFKEAFALLYIPAFASPRVEDIWRGYIAQRLLWEIDGRLLFTYPTAYTSIRNAHNYLKDFQSELPLYLEVHKLIEILDSLSLSSDLSASLIKTYKAITKAGLLPKEEVKVVENYVKELEKII